MRITFGSIVAAVTVAVVLVSCVPNTNALNQAHSRTVVSALARMARNNLSNSTHDCKVFPCSENTTCSHPGCLGRPQMTMPKIEASVNKTTQVLKDGIKCEAKDFAFDVATDKIDIVYTWVNYTEPDWSRHFGSILADHPKPYNTFQELRYSLRSLFEYGLDSKIGNIFVVHSDTNQPPNYLKADPRLRFVKHSEIFPSSTVLPVNNRNAIAWNLHRIKGLGNWFMYSEDDMYLARSFDWSVWFDVKSSKVKTYLTAKPDDHPVSSYAKLMANTVKLLDKKFPARTRLTEGVHTPVISNKCILHEIEQTWADEITLTIHQKEQSADDVHWQTMYQNYLLDTGRGVPGDIGFIAETHTNAGITRDQFINNLLDYSSEKYYFVNIQGPGVSDEYPADPRFTDVLNKWCVTMYPRPSPFELLDVTNNVAFPVQHVFAPKRDGTAPVVLTPLPNSKEEKQTAVQSIKATEQGAPAVEKK
eukprot:GFYU01003498.1.p1 GENE.GFYU01003498.1~~GFYU01003498.1.p1  ORF type:complete len:475 (+),score=152.54 GFYU01003498.1:112-1536(+)